MNINFELYRVFYFVSKAGSISNAAKELYISQPAVSQAIKQLEEKLGGQLFFRTSKGIILTAEGEVLYKYIEQAYSFITTAEQKFAEMQNLLSGEIRIGASDTLCRYFLIPHLEKFHRDFPEIRIQVTNRTTAEIISQLKLGKVDLGIVNLPLETENQLVIKESGVIQDCFVAGPNYKFLADTEIALADLARYPLLLLDKGTVTRRYIDRFAAGYGITLLPEVELGSIDLLVEFAKIGLGISFVIKDYLATELAEQTLYEIKLREPISPRKIGIVTLKDVPLSAVAKKFIEILET
ncbi:MAG TPA: LysR family transcriptional regulator [Bacillota bacterium]|nr:LysR family transcriptional regulator [Bacillota bacterium]